MCAIILWNLKKKKRKKIFNTHHVYTPSYLFILQIYVTCIMYKKEEWLNCDDTFGMYVFSVLSVDEREKETKYNLSIMSLISFFFNVLVIVRIFFIEDLYISKLLNISPPHNSLTTYIRFFSPVITRLRSGKIISSMYRLKIHASFFFFCFLFFIVTHRSSFLTRLIKYRQTIIK